MAIWQYKIFIVPQEEINSYFEKDEYISESAFNEIKWWKFRQLNIQDFITLKYLLPINKSWTDDIVLFGDESSNCVEVLIEEDKIIEVSARIDLRDNYKEVLRALCEFAQRNNCVFLRYDLKILNANLHLVESDILNYPTYKSFLDKLKD